MTCSQERKHSESDEAGQARTGDNWSHGAVAVIYLVDLTAALQTSPALPSSELEHEADEASTKARDIGLWAGNPKPAVQPANCRPAAQTGNHVGTEPDTRNSTV